MTLDTKIKTMIAVGAIAFATAVLPEQSYAQVNPQVLLEETRFDISYLEKYTKRYDAFIAKYGTVIGKAAFRASSRINPEIVESDIALLLKDPEYAKMPSEVAAAIISSLSMVEMKEAIKFVKAVDAGAKEDEKKLGLTLSKPYRSEGEIDFLVEYYDIVRECQDSKFEVNSIIDYYLESYDYELFGPISNKSGIIAIALSGSEDEGNEIISFGKSLIKDKKYSKELAETVMVAYARGNYKSKDAFTNLVDALIANKYSEKLVIGMVYAFGFGVNYNRLTEKDWMVFNERDNLERVVSMLKGRYDDSTIGLILEAYGTNEKPQYNK